MSFYSSILLIVMDASDEETEDFEIHLPASSGNREILAPMTGRRMAPLVLFASVNYIDFRGAAKALDDHPWPRDTRETSILVYDDEDASKPKAMGIDEAIAFLRAQAPVA